MYAPLLPKGKVGTGLTKTIIAARCEDCTQQFTRLCDSLPSRFPDNTIAFLADCLAQFITWGNETGARDKDLDHRLRNSSDMHDIIVDILSQLQSLLDDG
jgi:hypothetical protein